MAKKNQREDRYTDNYGNPVTETRDTSHTLEAGADAIAESLQLDEEEQEGEYQRRPSQHPGENNIDAAANEIFDNLDEDEFDNPEPVDPDAEEAEAEDVEADEYDDDEDVDAEEGDEPELHKVKVDGEEVEVTYDELVNGYSRQADYTRKSQAVAEQRRAVEQKGAVVEKMAESYAQRLEALANAQQSLNIPPEQMKAIEQEYVQTRQFQAQQELDQHMRTLEAERKALTEAIPEWQKNPEVADQEKTAMLEYAVRDLGYAPEEVQQVADHRAMLLLRKAMKYDQIQAKAGDVKSKKKTSKTLQPGARQKTHPNAKGRKAAEKAMSRARRTGRVEDAAAAMLASGLLD